MTNKIGDGRWWGQAWSLVDGCTPVSEGCKHCWLLKMDHWLRGDGQVLFREDRLELPARTQKSTVWAIWSDLNHPAILDNQICAAFDEMECSERHTFLWLTKRPERFDDILRGYTPISENVWLGVSVENQARADERMPHLMKLAQAGWNTFVSYEPALSPVDFTPWLSGIKCIILGGETGPGARPMHPDWARKVRDDCAEAGVPFYFKQWGEWVPQRQQCVPHSSLRMPRWGTLDIDGNWMPSTTPWNGREGADSEEREYVMVYIGKKMAGRFLDGHEHNDLPWVTG